MPARVHVMFVVFAVSSTVLGVAHLMAAKGPAAKPRTVAAAGTSAR